jgi:hypothetical protein
MNKTKTTTITPKDTFLNVLSFVCLYLSAFSLINLLLQYIDFLLPDINRNGYHRYLQHIYNSMSSQIRWSSSILIIMLPVYLLTSWILEKDFLKHPTKRKNQFRGWLIYLTLFIVAITMIGNLVLLIYSFYGGELTTRFILKLLSVMFIAIAIFAYYMWELRRDSQESQKLKLIAGFTSFIVTSCIVSGFFIIGTPATIRTVKLDYQRVNDLDRLQQKIKRHWTKKSRLPKSIDDLLGTVPNDPKTSTAYEYKIISPLSFELCAVFQKPNHRSEYWAHDEGRTCFTHTIDPKLDK